MNFEFATANRILFGAGSISQLPDIAACYGKRVLVITGTQAQRHADVMAGIHNGGLQTGIFNVCGEPTVDVAVAATAAAREFRAEFIAGIGGGSVVDTAKAVAALVSNEGEVLDYLEVIGSGKPLTNPPLPCIAVPTTAGTGSEVTRNAVLGSPEHAVKVSLRSPLMLPDVAIIDPEMTYSVPAAVTATTGLDALTQVLEPFVSKFANPVTDAFCREGLIRAGRSLRKAVHNGDDTAAREDMALASLFGGFALANAKLGAVHGFAGPLGGMYDAAHGAICACLLGPVMSSNIQQLRNSGDTHYLDRYAETARLLTGDQTASIEDGVEWVTETAVTLGIPKLSEFGVAHSEFDKIAKKAQRASSMKGNPVELTLAQLHEILDTAF